MTQTISVTLDATQFNLIINTLAERPYREVAELLAHLQRQAIEQTSQQEAPSGPITRNAGS